MSELFLGIDTSNYTSSCALYDSNNDSFISLKKLLPVEQGNLGLRQSDAVFHHTKNLPPLLCELADKFTSSVKGVGVSYAPRDCDGSYMPCFSVGEGYGVVLAQTLNASLYKFSHQAGHVAAALWSSGQTQLVEKEFIAFHFSGGTTNVLHVKPDTDKVFSIETVSASLDLKAGQAVDRAGVMLGLPFPAGKELDRLACMSDKEYRTKPYFRDGSCSFSGLENKCITMKNNNEPDCDIAKFCIDYICEAVRLMTKHAISRFGELPLIYAGGVMSNSIISRKISEEFGGYFALPEYSSDNAAGTAYLAYIKEVRK